MVFLGQKSTIGKRDALEMSCLQSFSLHPSFFEQTFLKSTLLKKSPSFPSNILIIGPIENWAAAVESEGTFPVEEIF